MTPVTKTHFRHSPTLLLGLVIAVLVTGCETQQLPWYRTRPEVEQTPPASTPPDFLYTEFAPLASWLDDQRFQVEYRNMTPKMVFEQMPINDVVYDLVDLPPETEFFELKSSNISRREILHQIAQRWNLQMSIELEDGLPERIRVEGLGELISTKARFPDSAESDIPGGAGY